MPTLIEYFHWYHLLGPVISWNEYTLHITHLHVTSEPRELQNDLYINPQET